MKEQAAAPMPPHEHTVEPGEINRRGCKRCELEAEARSAALPRRSKPIIAVLGCPACNGRGDGCQECAEQGWIITEPTEPPIVYMTRARYDELQEANGG